MGHSCYDVPLNSVEIEQKLAPSKNINWCEGVNKFNLDCFSVNQIYFIHFYDLYLFMIDDIKEIS